ncbi:CitMHS family transporter [Priestia filamentosa]|uniref:CitMHS family transporter n=1 Tax=Priestia filamentosa TaxID=1402861 RepID=UPI00234A6E75|nr:citrate:proton symporter [Priestia filamentosa]WCM14375.1 citrate:proton symporter [Priestia filamentosa]
MIALLGLLTIGTFLFLIMTKRVSVLVSLVLVPILFGLIGGFGRDLGNMMLDGLIQVAPTGIMIVFAILYFGLMLDAGLFDPMIAKIVAVVKGDPLKIVVGTALLTLVVHLDGDGAATFMITISALLPIYKKLNMNPLILSGVVGLAAGVMNMTPWGGPTARAMATLDAQSSDIFNPIIPAMLGGIVWVLFIAYILGRKEQRRLGILKIDEDYKMLSEQAAAVDESAKRPNLFWFNVLLTLTLLVSLICELLPMPILFLVAFVIALFINYPHPKDQQERLTNHASNIIVVCTMIFAAGIFTGVLTGTKMIEEMSLSLVSIIPDSLGGYLPVLVAITSMPLSLVFTPDAYYFGVLPILSETAASFGVNPHEIGRAAILGQMTTGFPLSPLTASTFILIGLTGVSLVDHQKFIFKWAFGTTLVMTVLALLTGAISI